MLAGCEGGVERFYDSKLSPDRPIDWWHQLQGGPVAALRPPPPGVDQPYPNFAAIPPKPTPIDPKARQSLLTRMTAQRDAARRSATQDPVVWPVAGSTRPPGAAVAGAVAPPAAGATRPAVAAPPDGESSKLVLDAASAPAAGAAEPAPVTPVDPHPPAGLRPAAPQAVVSGPIPAVPTEAPALPALAGLPVSVPVPVVVRRLPSARIGFAAGSSALPTGAEAALQGLAARRADGVIAVEAGGGAQSADVAAQRAALPLALRRAGVVTAALVAAGVPAGSIRAEAVALGREVWARVVE